MSAPRPDNPQERADAMQRAAADPSVSSWVSASAGAGKTTVLVNRVLRLLLGGARPGAILCLTFTRAAAAEMANRLDECLAGWATMDDKKLAAELNTLAGAAPGDDTVAIARRLFAHVLDAPGGINIQTIHGFCESLLKRFPLEAGVAPHFQIMDERDAGEARAETLRQVLRLYDADGGGLRDAITILSTRAAEDRIADLTGALLGARDRLDITTEDGPAALVAQVHETLGVNPRETRDGILATAAADGAFDSDGLRAAARAMRESGKTDQKHGAIIADWLAATPAARAGGFDVYLEAFFTGGGGGARFAHLIHKEALEKAQEADETLATEAERLTEVRTRLRALDIAQSTAALLRLGGELLDRYGTLKTVKAALDYDDLIIEAGALLTRADMAPWVLYKLDGGIDHVLIDEAQDTSPAQWRVISTLVDEFFVGMSARETARTVFAVGDIKQSIFSFQGADPAAAERVRRDFAARVPEAGRTWRPIELDVSFRSTEAVLDAVDGVFADGPAREGLMFGAEHPIRHLASRAGQAGRVEIWPPAVPVEPEEEPPWTPPVTRRDAEPPRTRLARRVAEAIADLVRGGTILSSTGAAARWRDVMVLVRQRGGFMEELVRALKAREVPVAGADRMALSQQIAVMDLLALGHFLLHPGDDLTLAALLKSPLVGLDEEQLFSLAHNRGKTSLWRRLGDRAGDGGVFATSHDFLARFLARADFTTPFDLYSELLAGEGGAGWRAMLGRLGHEAEDPIEEFLDLALAYERTHAPSLQGFLHWFEAGETEIKRDLEQSERDEVRIITVHGAKGLEAPVVFLPDTIQAPRARGPHLLWDEDGAGPPLWLPRVGLAEDVTQGRLDALKRRGLEEYHRLLYVAMTRARDRLYVCGWFNREKLPEASWYDLVRRSLADRARALDIEFGEGWSGAGLWIDSGTPPAAVAPAPAEKPTPEPLPGWARRPPAAEPAPPRPLAPSRPREDEPAVRSPLGPAAEDRFARGRLIHRLLQFLPEIDAARRAQSCRHFLARPMHGLDAPAQAEIMAEILAVLDAPELADFFGAGSLAEAPIVGVVGGHVVSGQVDRLWVAEDAVAILDYKTNRPPPTQVADVPAIYLRQMAAYRAVLSQIYPRQRVRCALVWTDGPTPMELPDDLLDAHAP